MPLNAPELDGDPSGVRGNGDEAMRTTIPNYINPHKS